MSVPLVEALQALNAAYPPALAEPWDAVGLVCGDPEQPVSRVLVAVDPVPETVDEAIEMDAQLLSILRYHDELDEKSRAGRLRQIHATFNPGPMRRMWRGVRNFVNTLRDAFNTAIGVAVGQFLRVYTDIYILSSKESSVTTIGQ